ncbi:hypothetical protein AVEN_59289-1 [Araneus ventricosus]|uniref:Uncharacterized protein n=1 Tax=Araneus ventricosus TaxID=182803 RepID=A0A4Y2U552_ARAVE|nr:hypothetical protein AVEN_59289-1 [Araneus ventricosus]
MRIPRFPSVLSKSLIGQEANSVCHRTHGPFSSFLNRFHLSDSDSCACGEVDDPMHYETSCPLTLSWHIRKPSTSLESLWYQRVLENPNSRKRIINMIKFITDNENIMRL